MIVLSLVCLYLWQGFFSTSIEIKYQTKMLSGYLLYRSVWGGVILLLGIPSFFYLVSTFAIPLMLCCIHLEKRLHQRFLNHAYSVISWCGRKSLEIYVGHSIGRYVVKHFLTTSDYILLYYVVFTILFTFIVDSLNKGIQRMV